MIERMIKDTAACVLWLFGSGALLFVNFIVLLANYLSSVVSFELSGYEMRPLASYRLVGPFFGAFLGQATLADFYAAGLALVVSAGAFFLAKALFSIHPLVDERRRYRLAGDVDSAAAVNRRLWLDAGVSLFLIALLTATTLWEIHLFRLRSLCNAFDIDDPATCAGSMPEWGRVLQQYGDLFSVQLANVGPAGYVSVTFLACLLLEYAFYRLHTAAAQLLAAAGAVVAGAPLLPLYDVAYAGADPRDVSPAALASSAAGGEAPAAQSNGSTPLFDPAVVAQPQTETTRVNDADEPVEVIGGAGGERVRRSEAHAQHDRYYVDEITGQVWDRRYRESLHSIPEDDDRPEAA
jgi:hypothetical protein